MSGQSGRGGRGRDAAPARVLVVEDETAMRTAIVGTLGSAGWQVRGVRRGRHRGGLGGFRPDLVVLD